MELQKQPTGPKSPFPKVVSLILGILAVVGGITTFMILKDVSGFKQEVLEGTKQEQATQQTGWNKPISTHQAIPVIERNEDGTPKGTLTLYDLTTKQLRKTDKKIRVQGGAIGFGNLDPLPSPDLLYTALLDDQKNLWLMSSETLQTIRLTDTGNVAYITGWSPNSTKLVYYITKDTLQTRRDGPVTWETKETFSHTENSASGFYLFDIESGKTTFLSPVEYIETFVDNDRLLVRAGAQSDRLIIFNLNTFEADFATAKESFGYGAGQFDIASDGTKWTYMLSRFPTSDANIIYAPFPNREGEQIDSGSWAMVQFPLFSPNASKIAYGRQESFINGFVTYNIWVYDVATKQKTRYTVEGFPSVWINETSLVVKSSNAAKPNDYLYLLDLTNGNATKLY